MEGAGQHADGTDGQFKIRSRCDQTDGQYTDFASWIITDLKETRVVIAPI